MKLSRTCLASIISLTMSNKTVETDKIWRGNNPSKWIQPFAIKFAYVIPILIEHAYGRYLKIAEQLRATFFIFLFFVFQQFIN